MEQGKWVSAAIFALALLSYAPLWGWTAADRDFDGDGNIGFKDFLFFAKALGSQDVTCDLNGNGEVDFTDFVMFARYYGKTVVETEIPDVVTVTLPPIADSSDVKMEFVYIPPGTFTMGYHTNYSSAGAYNPYPLHEVTISKGFYLGKYEVTQAQWEVLMGATPWAGHQYYYVTLNAYEGTWLTVQEGPNYPASVVSWEECQQFIDQLNSYIVADATGKFRLPTEAEWEYVCRAGTTTDYWFVDDTIVDQFEDRITKITTLSATYSWCVYNTFPTASYAHKVGARPPNPWGLYDITGNVAEWVSDIAGGYPETAQVDPRGPVSGSGHIYRGGHFLSSALSLPSWWRGLGAEGHREMLIGFRVLMEVK